MIKTPKFVLIVGWFLFFPQIVSAQVTIDYSDQLGPNRMQKESNWCFAFAGSDALSFALGYPPSEQISALDFAVQAQTADYSKLIANLNDMATQEGISKIFAEAPLNMAKAQRNVNLLITDKGGYTITAIAANLHMKGYCREQDAPGVEFNQSSQTFINFLEQRMGYSYLKDLKLFMLNKVKFANCKVDRDLIDSATDVETLASIFFKTCRLSLSNLEKSKLQTKKVQSSNRLTKSIGQACNRYPIKSALKFFYSETPHKKQDALAMLKRLLSSGPVSITIDSNYLKGLPLRGGSNHEVLVVSEKLEGQKISYRIRNPWPCSSLRKDIIETCKNGEFWINADELLLVTTEMASIFPAND